MRASTAFMGIIGIRPVEFYVFPCCIVCIIGYDSLLGELRVVMYPTKH